MTDTIQLVSDEDIFIGLMDTESYSDNPPLIFAYSGIPTGTVITSLQMRLFFRIEGASCEDDIEIRVTDPLGNVTEFVNSFVGCVGSDNNALYEFSAMLNAAGLADLTSGNWTIELKDSNDQNSMSAGSPGNNTPAGTEYSMIFGDIQYITESATDTSGCPTIDITLTSQEDIDNFASNYPNCTDLSIHMMISDNFTTPITNLNGLANITTVTGKLDILYNNDLTSLEGLENLTTIPGELVLYYNEGLTSLAGLENLVSIGTLFMRGNSALTSLSNLESLTSAESITVTQNALATMAGLENIDSIPSLHISEGLLTSLTGLENLAYVGGGGLSISSFDLTSFSSLSNLTIVEGTLHISDILNATNFVGLENLNIIGSDFLIDFSTGLTTLEGLENLETIGSGLSIWANDSLATLTGLNNLSYIGAGIDILENFALTTLSGLESLNYAKSIYLLWNPILTDVTGLGNIAPESLESLSIHDNWSLSNCSVESLCYYLLEGGESDIMGNVEGCNSPEEIIDGCSSVWEYAVEGNIFADFNEDCFPDTSETGLVNWIVKVENAEDTRYAYTYDDGRYIAPVDAGTYNVTAIPPNSLWEDVCFESDIATLTTFNTRDTLDFGASTSTFCPLLEVDVTAPFVRRCFDSDYYVRYCNSGTAIAENAYVEVQLDPFFTYQNSTIAGIDLGENLYSFNLGNVDIGECGSFRIDVYVDCDSTEIGQTHCVEAHIYPDSICEPVLPLWDESSIVVDARCLGDSIEFKIENIGVGDMSDSLEYLIVEDDLIWHRANFQLDSGKDLKFYKQANGAFHRLEAEQPPGHPGNSMPSVFVEGCGEGDNGEISMGFINYYLLDEGDAFVSIDCQENVGSYDPNDKQAFPVGYGAPHYITDSTDLEYMIRFQNTGTDTAFNIVIRDTISPHLNIETLRPGVASHDYRYDIEESNIAVFHFENIMLPDSNVNEAASHGFIKFNIEQQRDNSIGTHIMNDAAIYFDFNEPIITNTVFHTVGEDFIGIVTSIITPPEVKEAGISVNVFPNPLDKYTRFEVEGEAVKELRLSVYDMMGREVLQQHSTHQQHITMKRNNLTPGVYVFRLMDEKQQLATGKLVVR